MESGHDIQDVLLQEYKLAVEYLTNHLTRLWSRFSFFLTLETALVVALLSLFRDGQPSRWALVIPGVALLLSVNWWVTGAQDGFWSWCTGTRSATSSGASSPTSTQRGPT